MEWIEEQDSKYNSFYSCTTKGLINMIISRGLKDDGSYSDSQWRIESDKDTINKAAELINLFAEVPLDAIKQCLATSQGQLALSVLTHCIKEEDYKELTPMKMLVDELQEKLTSVEYNKDYVSRESLVRELDDVLRAKSITPYRRQRINRAFKRECLECLGTGKAGRVISDTKDQGRLLYAPRKIKIGVSQTDNDCPTCKGTGAKPKELDKETKSIGTVPPDKMGLLPGEEYTN